MTQEEIKDTIKDLKDGLNSSFTPEQFKPRMEAKIKELEAQLTTASKPAPVKPKTETPAPKFKRNPFDKIVNEAQKRSSAEFKAKQEREQKKEEKPLKSKSVTFSNGSQKISVDIISEDKDGTYRISKKVAKALLKSNRFNDDKWGQMCVTDDPNDDMPNWVFIEDTKDEDEYSVLDDGKYIFLAVSRSIEIVGTNQPSPASKIAPASKKETPPPEKKKSVPQPKAKEDKYPEDEDDYCAKVIAQAKERRKKAKERAKLPQKTEGTKNKEKIEKVLDNVKERAKVDDISQAELWKLIKETEQLLNLLNKTYQDNVSKGK